MEAFTHTLCDVFAKPPVVARATEDSSLFRTARSMVIKRPGRVSERLDTRLLRLRRVRLAIYPTAYDRVLTTEPT